MLTLPACRVCGTPDCEPIYCSREHASLTTMGRLYEQPTEVFFCGQCGHLQTKEIIDIEDYYAHQYAILAESPEEDQLYKIIEGKPVFQVEHRVRTLRHLIALPPGARVLDFGCAKGSLIQRLVQERPDIQPFLFDVTERYVPFWRSWAEPSQWATGTTPASWAGKFDVVCSFYVLEHVADPVAIVSHMASLLKPGGTLYFLVPNVLANSADMVVADHLQHYSESSLAHLLERANVDTVKIDDRSHDGAYLAVAQRPLAAPRASESRPHGAPRLGPSPLREAYQAMSRFWSGSASRISHFEEQHVSSDPACIYGAGFYGTFIASCLKNPATVSCFVDQNPFMQGRRLQGKPIVAPVQLAKDVSTMYVGLNPTIARSVIGDMGCWSGRQFETFYL